MNEEEAKETLKTMKENIDKKYLKTRNSVAIETALNLLEKKDKQLEQYQNMLATNDMLHVLELEKKDKIIDLMAEELSKLNYIQYCNVTNCNYPPCNKKQCTKQYFERKVEEK